MRWTALLPLKARGERKTRLAGALDAEARAHLSDAMAAHVLAMLRRTPEVAAVHILAPLPMLDADWLRDRGRGLNAELAAARDALGADRLLVVSGDLPFLSPEELSDLLNEAAAAGFAAAADRKGLGTNAVAIAGLRPFRFAFGPGSLAAHERQGARSVSRPGLAFDIDDEADLADAVAASAMNEIHDRPTFFSLLGGS